MEQYLWKKNPDGICYDNIINDIKNKNYKPNVHEALNEIITRTPFLQNIKHLGEKNAELRNEHGEENKDYLIYQTNSYLFGKDNPVTLLPILDAKENGTDEVTFTYQLFVNFSTIENTKNFLTPQNYDLMASLYVKEENNVQSHL